MENRKKAWIGALCSLWIPGLGQLYLDAFLTGAVFLFANAFLAPFIVWTIPFFPAPLWIYLYFSASALALLLTVVASWHAFHLAERSSSPSLRTSRRKFMVLVAASVAWYLLGVYPSYATLHWRVEPYSLPTESMLPTLLRGDQFLVDKTIHGADVRRGMVIVFVPPKERAVPFAKRVIGLPGDRVRFVGTQVFVNDQPLSRGPVVALGDPELDHWLADQDAEAEEIDGRRYTVFWHKKRGGIPAEAATSPREVLVAPNSLFVLGDNRDVAYDSRYWGFVSMKDVLGEVKQIYFSWRDNQRLRPKRWGLVVR